MRKLAATIVIMLIASCGGSGLDPYPNDVPTHSPPLITRIDSESASPGDTVTIYGLGYSIIPAYNLVTFGSVSAVADSYDFIDPGSDGEFEILTVVIPDDVEAGINPVMVTVHRITSNDDVSIDIIP
ncbi:MAG: hypothetical protein BWY40_00308 [bacterium ADurb.Bin270]|nr:MAG: hypothetical protein BWY40_00308 [bacterium ADurb.Bin270]